MFNQILLAADGSDASAAAVATAIGLAREQQAQLLVVHVVDVYAMYFATPESIDFLVAAGEGILKAVQDQAHQSGVVVHTKLLQSDVGGRHISELIIDESNAWPADLVVIGSHGRRGLNHFLIGSVAEGVCQRARTPVLLSR